MPNVRQEVGEQNRTIGPEERERFTATERTPNSYLPRMVIARIAINVLKMS
jgi:hypothetical protein